jgi:hypothetical protein
MYDEVYSTIRRRAHSPGMFDAAVRKLLLLLSSLLMMTAVFD